MPFNPFRRSGNRDLVQAATSTRRRPPAVEPLEDRMFLSGTGITPVIVSSTVPSAVVTGGKLHASLKLALTDSLPTAESGFTVSVFASPTPTLDPANETLVTSLVRPNRIKPLQTIGLDVPITSLPAALPNGTYYLIAETTDLAGNVATTSTNSTVTVAAPFVAFVEDVSSTLPPALVSGSTIKGTVRVGITNNGNVAAKGVTTVNLSASTVAGVPGTSIAITSKRVNIPVGRTVTVAVPVKTLPVLANGTYFLVAEVTDPNGGVTVASSPSVTIAAPFVTLTGTVAAITKVQSGATIFVTNGGNVVDSTQLHGTFGFSLDAAGTIPAGTTATLTSPHLNIKPGKTVSFHVRPNKAFLSGLTAGVPYYLTVTFSDNTGNTGMAVSPNSFTI